MSRRRTALHVRILRRLSWQIEQELESLTTRGVWRVLVLSIACVAGVSYQLAPLEFDLDPLYVLPLCLAGWRLGLRVSLGVAVATALISAAVCLVLNDDVAMWVRVGNTVMLAMIFSLIACIVSSFRYRFDQERYHANRDRMTGALNRHAFTTQLDKMISDKARHCPFMLAYVDLDGFKSVNDNLGHHAGDQLLRRFSVAAMRELRGIDRFGRLGGDEFGVLAPVSSEDQGNRFAAHLHDRFAGILTDMELAVTCSIGVLIVPHGRAYASDNLLRQADQLMYAVKRSGRNGVRVARAGRSSETSPSIDPAYLRPLPEPESAD